MAKELNHVALLGLGHSQLDYHLSITHSEEYDEVWAVNSMCIFSRTSCVIVFERERLRSTFTSLVGRRMA